MVKITKEDGSPYPALDDKVYSLLEIARAIEVVTEGNEILIGQVATALDMLKKDPTIFDEIESEMGAEYLSPEHYKKLMN
jgi:hypothetical protein